jgi:hypothetical protein
MVAKKIVTVHGSKFGVNSIMQSYINLEPGTCEPANAYIKSYHGVTDILLFFLYNYCTKTGSH